MRRGPRLHYQPSPESVGTFARKVLTMTEALVFAVAFGIAQGLVAVLMIVGAMLLIFCAVGAFLDIRNNRQ